jgi:hypothetical protein
VAALADSVAVESGCDEGVGNGGNHQRGGSCHGWCREATEDQNFMSPSAVLKTDMGMISGSNAFLIY